MASTLLKYANPDTVLRNPSIPSMSSETYSLFRDLQNVAGDVGRTANSPSILRYADRAMDFSKPFEKPSGTKIPIIGGVLANPLVRTALKPLELLSIPKNLILSTAKEISDLGNPNQKASFSDWFTQVKDPTFGAGDVFGKTGNKWLDRFIGFAGDVAFDPLTYLGLGAGRFLGQEGRVALAADLAAVQAPKELVEKAGQLGINAFDTAERNLVRSLGVNVPEAGVRFAGTLIPGTERIAEVAGKGFAKTRFGLYSNSKVGQAVRNLGLPDAVVPMYESILTKKGPYSTTNAAGTLGAVKRGSGYEARFVIEEMAKLDPVLKKLTADDNNYILQALETGTVPAAGVAKEVADGLEAILKRLQSEGVQIEGLKNYFPHIWTDEGRKLLLADSALGIELRKVLNITKDQVATPTVLQHRGLGIGEHVIAGRKIKITTGTVTEFNQKIWETFPELVGTKLLNDNVDEVLRLYVTKAAKAYSNQKVAQRLVDIGIGVDEASNIVRGVDETATKAARTKAKTKAVKEATKAQKAAKKEYAATSSKLKKTIDSIQAKFNKDLTRRKKAVAAGGQAVAKDVAEADKEITQLLQDINALTSAKDPTETFVAGFEGVVQKELASGKFAPKDSLSLPELMARTVALRKMAEDQLAAAIAEQQIKRSGKMVGLYQAGAATMEAQRNLDVIIQAEQALQETVADLARLNAEFRVPGRADFGPDIRNAMANNAERDLASVDRQIGRLQQERGRLVNNVDNPDAVRKQISDIDQEIARLQQERALPTSQRKKVKVYNEATKKTALKSRTNATLDAKIAEAQQRRVKLVDMYAQVSDEAGLVNASARITQIDSEIAALEASRSEMQLASMGGDVRVQSDQIEGVLGSYANIVSDDFSQFSGVATTVQQNAYRAAQNQLSRVQGRDIILESRSMLDAIAPGAMRQLQEAIDGIVTANSVRAQNEIIRNRIDDIERITRDFTRQTELKNRIYERLNNNPNGKGLTAKEERFLKNYYEVTVPEYNSIPDRRFDLNALQDEVDVRVYESQIREARAQTVRVYRSKIATGYLGQSVQDRMVQNVEALFDDYVAATEILKNFNTRRVMDVGRATNLAKEMNIVASRMEETNLKLALQHDFKYRFDRTKSLLTARGIEHTDETLGARVYIEVLKSYDQKLAQKENELITKYNRVYENVQALDEAELQRQATVNLKIEGEDPGVRTRRVQEARRRVEEVKGKLRSDVTEAEDLLSRDAANIQGIIEEDLLEYKKMASDASAAREMTRKPKAKGQNAAAVAKAEKQKAAEIARTKAETVSEQLDKLPPDERAIAALESEFVDYEARSGYVSEPTDFEIRKSEIRENVGILIFGDANAFTNEREFLKFLQFIEWRPQAKYAETNTAMDYFNPRRLNEYLRKELNKRQGARYAEDVARARRFRPGQGRAVALVSPLDTMAEDIVALRAKRVQMAKLRTKLGGNRIKLESRIGSDGKVLALSYNNTGARYGISVNAVAVIEDAPGTRLGWRIGTKAVRENQTMGIDEVVNLIDDASDRIRTANVSLRQTQDNIKFLEAERQALKQEVKAKRELAKRGGILQQQADAKLEEFIVANKVYDQDIAALKLQAQEISKEIETARGSIETLKKTSIDFAMTGGESRVVARANWRDSLFGATTSKEAQEIKTLGEAIFADTKLERRLSAELQDIDASTRRSTANPTERVVYLENELARARVRENAASAAHSKPDVVQAKESIRALDSEVSSNSQRLSELTSLDPAQVEEFANKLNDLQIRLVESRDAIERAIASGDPELPNLIEADRILVKEFQDTRTGLLQEVSLRQSVDNEGNIIQAEIEGLQFKIAMEKRLQSSLDARARPRENIYPDPARPGYAKRVVTKREDALTRGRAGALIKQSRDRSVTYAQQLDAELKSLTERLVVLQRERNLAGLGVTAEGYGPIKAQMDELLARNAELVAQKKSAEAYVANTLKPYDGPSVSQLEGQLRTARSEVQRWRAQLTPEQASARTDEIADELSRLSIRLERNRVRRHELLQGAPENRVKYYYRKREELFAEQLRVRTILAADDMATSPTGPYLSQAGVFNAKRGAAAETFQERSVRLQEANNDLNQVLGGNPVPAKRAELQNIQREVENVRNDIGANINLKIDDVVAAQQRRTGLEQLSTWMNEQLATLNAKPNLSANELAFQMDALRWVNEAQALMAGGLNTDQIALGAQTVLDRGAKMSGNEAEQFAKLAAGEMTQEQHAVMALLQDAHLQAGKLIFDGSSLRATTDLLSAAKNSDFGHIVVYQLADGWESIAKTGVAVPTEVRAMMQRLSTLREPSKWAGFVRAWESYNSVFKAYATLSPRFHMRNSMSATFMNFADGVAAKNMVDGANLWRAFADNPNDWVKNLKNLSESDLKMIDDAITAVFMSGGGQYNDITWGVRGTRNRVVQLSKRVGTNVEGSVRLGMALDTLRNGGTMEEAAARITRTHFNYSSVSEFDRAAKRIIPFYTFMRYNLPMQVQMMWSKPRAYLIYRNFVMNFQGEEDGVVPSGVLTADMFKAPFGKDMYINADLGFSRIEQDLAMIADPMKFIGSTSPLLKVPIELWAGKQFYENIPLRSNDFVPLSGVSAMLSPILEGMGVVETNAQGQKVISKKTLYAVQQLFPYGSTIDRLSGAGSQAGKQQANIASFVGLPIKQVTDAERRGELLSRLQALAALQERQRGLGY